MEKDTQKTLDVILNCLFSGNAKCIERSQIRLFSGEPSLSLSGVGECMVVALSMFVVLLPKSMNMTVMVITMMINSLPSSLF